MWLTSSAAWWLRSQSAHLALNDWLPGVRAAPTTDTETTTAMAVKTMSRARPLRRRRGKGRRDGRGGPGGRGGRGDRAVGRSCGGARVIASRWAETWTRILGHRTC